MNERSNERFFNAEYFREVRQLKKEHINRYSERQVSIGYSLLCTLFASSVFALNYYYQIVPRHVAVWTVFVIFPYFLYIFDYATGKYRYGYEE